MEAPDGETQINENAPLLKGKNGDDASGPPKGSQHHQLWVVLGVALLVLTTNMPDIMADAPETLLYESIFCSQWYKVHDPSLVDHKGAVNKEHCRIGPVQMQISTLKGWLSFFGFLPGQHFTNIYAREVLDVADHSKACFSLYRLGTLRISMDGNGSCLWVLLRCG